LRVYSGKLELADLSIKKDSVDGLDLPLTILKGTIQNVRIHVPWSRIAKDPVRIEISGLSLRVRPRGKEQHGWSLGREAAEQALKRCALEALDIARKQQLQLVADLKGQESFVEKLVTKLIENLELKFVNISFELEDEWQPSSAQPVQQLILGVRLDSFVVEPATASSAKSGDQAKYRCKSLVYQGLCVFLDPNRQRGEPVQYLLHPCSGTFVLRRCLSSATRDLSITITPEQLEFRCVVEQVKCLKHISTAIGEFDQEADRRLLKYGRLRPLTAIGDSPRAWLQYSVKCVMLSVRKRCTWRSFGRHVTARKLYILLYTAKLEGTITPHQQTAIEEMELGWNNQCLVKWRGKTESLLQVKALAEAQKKKHAEDQKPASSGSGWFTSFFRSSSSASPASEEDLISQSQLAELHSEIDHAEAIDLGRANLNVSLQLQLLQLHFGGTINTCACYPVFTLTPYITGDEVKEVLAVRFSDFKFSLDRTSDGIVSSLRMGSMTAINLLPATPETILHSPAGDAGLLQVHLAFPSSENARPKIGVEVGQLFLEWRPELMVVLLSGVGTMSEGAAIVPPRAGSSMTAMNAIYRKPGLQFEAVLRTWTIYFYKHKKKLAVLALDNATAVFQLGDEANPTTTGTVNVGEISCVAAEKKMFGMSAVGEDLAVFQVSADEDKIDISCDVQMVEVVYLHLQVQELLDYAMMGVLAPLAKSPSRSVLHTSEQGPSICFNLSCSGLALVIPDGVPGSQSNVKVLCSHPRLEYRMVSGADGAADIDLVADSLDVLCNDRSVITTSAWSESLPTVVEGKRKCKINCKKGTEGHVVLEVRVPQIKSEFDVELLGQTLLILSSNLKSCCTESGSRNESAQAVDNSDDDEFHDADSYDYVIHKHGAAIAFDQGNKPSGNMVVNLSLGEVNVSLRGSRGSAPVLEMNMHNMAVGLIALADEPASVSTQIDSADCQMHENSQTVTACIEKLCFHQQGSREASAMTVQCTLQVCISGADRGDVRHTLHPTKINITSAGACWTVDLETDLTTKLEVTDLETLVTCLQTLLHLETAALDPIREETQQNADVFITGVLVLQTGDSIPSGYTVAGHIGNDIGNDSARKKICVRKGGCELPIADVVAINVPGGCCVLPPEGFELICQLGLGASGADPVFLCCRRVPVDWKSGRRSVTALEDLVFLSAGQKRSGCLACPTVLTVEEGGVEQFLNRRHGILQRQIGQSQSSKPELELHFTAKQVSLHLIEKNAHTLIVNLSDVSYHQIHGVGSQCSINVGMSYYLSGSTQMAQTRILQPTTVTVNREQESLQASVMVACDGISLEVDKSCIAALTCWLSASSCCSKQLSTHVDYNDFHSAESKSNSRLVGRVGVVSVSLMRADANEGRCPVAKILLSDIAFQRKMGELLPGDSDVELFVGSIVVLDTLPGLQQPIAVKSKPHGDSEFFLEVKLTSQSHQFVKSHIAHSVVRVHHILEVNTGWELLQRCLEWQGDLAGLYGDLPVTAMGDAPVTLTQSTQDYGLLTNGNFAGDANGNDDIGFNCVTTRLHDRLYFRLSGMAQVSRCGWRMAVRSFCRCCCSPCIETSRIPDE
jgi:hypothetical protein